MQPTIFMLALLTVTLKTPDADKLEKKSFPVVGLGASARGLEALEALFNHPPPAQAHPTGG